jgi:hypothetical protein
MASDDSEPLGQFGHHPDPDIDLCVEIGEIETTLVNLNVFSYHYKARNKLVAKTRVNILRCAAIVTKDPMSVVAQAKLKHLAGHFSIHPAYVEVMNARRAA